ncbi:MAG: 2OG-Fe(II) oxygenase [Deltaproteobacteria bacterium]|nr:MAG: 2OG-Fe(II) oxygenase [Deltaproteobacteria bacterium]
MSAPRVEVAATGEGRAPAIAVLPAADLGPRDLLAAIAAEELGGVVITGAFDPGELAALVAHLEAHPGPAGPLRSAHFPGITWGQLLVLSPPDRVGYHERAADLRALLATAPLDIEQRFLAGLARAAGGRRVAVPTDAAGRPYAGLTVRALPPGVEIAVHSETGTWPSMADLVEGLLVDGHQLSTYAPLVVPPDGGVLQVFHRPPPGRQPPVDRLPHDAAIDALTSFGLTRVRPRPGDLLIFDGSRYNHRVLASAAGTRWTAGGFVGRGPEGWLLWS